MTPSKERRATLEAAVVADYESREYSIVEIMKRNGVARSSVYNFCSRAGMDISVAKRRRTLTQIERLEAALRPFVEKWEKHADPIGDSDLDDEQPVSVWVTLGDFRRARSALTRLHTTATQADGGTK